MVVKTSKIRCIRKSTGHSVRRLFVFVALCPSPIRDHSNFTYRYPLFIHFVEDTKYIQDVFMSHRLFLYYFFAGKVVQWQRLHSINGVTEFPQNLSVSNVVYSSLTIHGVLEVQPVRYEISLSEKNFYYWLNAAARLSSNTRYFYLLITIFTLMYFVN